MWVERGQNTLSGSELSFFAFPADKTARLKGPRRRITEAFQTRALCQSCLSCRIGTPVLVRNLWPHSPPHIRGLISPTDAVITRALYPQPKPTSRIVTRTVTASYTSPGALMFFTIHIAAICAVFLVTPTVPSLILCASLFLIRKFGITAVTIATSPTAPSRPPAGSSSCWHGWVGCRRKKVLSGGQRIIATIISTRTRMKTSIP